MAEPEAGDAAEGDERPSDKYALIDREEHPEVYALLEELVQAHHVSDLCEARLALAWVYGTKADRDGHLVLGKARKVGALEQQFHQHDFVIVLNAEAWKALDTPSRRALMDHELSHCAARTDDDGETHYYLRKHDLEEFVSIVRRHGLWTENAQALVKAALEHDPELRLFPEKKPAVKSVTLSANGKSVTLTGKPSKTMP